MSYHMTLWCDQHVLWHHSDAMFHSSIPVVLLYLASHNYEVLSHHSYVVSHHMPIYGYDLCTI
jgi:hypothetical protein